MITTYEQQWRILDKARAMGWTGTVPGVLGTYQAGKQLAEAKRFIADNRAKEE